MIKAGDGRGGGAMLNRAAALWDNPTSPPPASAFSASCWLTPVTALSASQLTTVLNVNVGQNKNQINNNNKKKKIHQ